MIVDDKSLTIKSFQSVCYKLEDITLQRQDPAQKKWPVQFLMAAYKPRHRS